jgi:phi LC3 family holin
MQKVGAEWSGRENPSNNMAAKNLKGLFKSLIHTRRKNKMQNTNWITLLPALIGAIKLILQPFGIDLSHVTDEQVNDVVNGIAALVTIIGIFMPHKKDAVKGMGDSGSAV